MRKGDWIQTWTGKQFYPLDPRPEEIDLMDIVVPLSRICRFTGHCSMPYTVAEHSIYVANHVSLENRLWALLHDASEAYLCDLPRPLKNLPEAAFYREAEKILQGMIVEKYGLSPTMPAEVKEADDRMLATEARDLTPNKPAVWGRMPEPYEDITILEPCWGERIRVVLYNEIVQEIANRAK